MVKTGAKKLQTLRLQTSLTCALMTTPPSISYQVSDYSSLYTPTFHNPDNCSYKTNVLPCPYNLASHIYNSVSGCACSASQRREQHFLQPYWKLSLKLRELQQEGLPWAAPVHRRGGVRHRRMARTGKQGRECKWVHFVSL